jgi:branched-subunit amino acid transport protein
MTWELLLALAALTYGSRVAALVLLPAPPARVRAVIDRIPPALFAGLAAHSLVIPGQGLVDAPTLAAAAGALVVAPLRSLPVCLVAGVAAYAAWSLVVGITT